MHWLRFPRVMGLVLCLFLAGMSVVFGVLVSRDAAFSSSAKTTTGTVVAMVRSVPAGSTRESSEHDKRQLLAPKVRFNVGDKHYFYTPQHGSYRIRYLVGDAVTIRYDASEPQATARIEDEGKIVTPLLCIGFAALALALAVVLVITRRDGLPGTPTVTEARTPDPITAGD